MPPAAGQWAERYRPRHLGEVIGNTDQIRKLAEWLRDWDDVVLHGKVKEQKAPEAWQKFQVQENINARAALISGPPGIGKTTTVTLIARCCPKYKVMEFNASDARSKVIIEHMSNSLAGNHTLKFNAGGGKSIERAVIIMDECDGMAGGDKGGAQALKKMIQTTKNPIICICNDRGASDVRDLATICYDIKFKKPDNATVAKRIKHVMEREGKKVEVRTIEAVIEACGHDIRQIINQTQFFGSVGLHGDKTSKDASLMLNPFDACERLLQLSSGPKVLPLPTRLDMYWLDTELMPMMVQENYLKTYEKRKKRVNDEEGLLQAAQAAELISIGDTMSGNWEVLSTSAIFTTVYPAFLTSDESFTRPGFPIWLQKRGPMNKAHKVAEELFAKIRGGTTCANREFITSSYHDLFYKKLLKPLQHGSAKETATMLFEHGLSREFFAEQAPVLRTPLNLEDNYKKIEGQIKNRLREELFFLEKEAKATKEPVKRMSGDDKGGAKKKLRGEETVEEEVIPEAKKAPAKKKKTVAEPNGSSLSMWKVKEVQTEEQIAQAVKEEEDRKPLMIMKYLDGHTNAVRRKVHMKDLLEPWRLF